MYLKNHNIKDESFDQQYKKKVECEKYMDLLKVL